MDALGTTSTPSVDVDRPRIGEILVKRGWISDLQLDTALAHQRSSGRRMGETLVELGVISTAQLAEALAERLGHDFLDLAQMDPDPVVSHQVPEELARRYCALAIRRSDDRTIVAMANPDDVFALDDLRVVTGGGIDAVMADPAAITRLLDRIWSHAEIASSLGDANDFEVAPSEIAQMTAEAGEGPIVRLVNAILEQAAAARASDVHIDPGEHLTRVRCRIDGLLHDTSEVPTRLHRAVVSRLKVMASIDIANARIPHDGRFTLTLRDRLIDVRVATLPTSNGEAAVLRLLDRRASALSLDELGLLPDERERYERVFRRSQGTILVAGPTGSGKTSTLYATLSELNDPVRNLVTVEDPIEYRLAGVKQVQVNPRAGLHFATALRSLLRADPDVILVGEIRDRETARTAAEAALTGHLVLSTIHTTSAASTPVRLIDMGVDAYLVASAVSGIVSQRLLRVLCERCRVIDELAGERLAALGFVDHDSGSVYRSVGCSQCGGTGYHGRRAAYEILEMTDAIASLVLRGAGPREIEARAVEQGLITLREATLRRVLAGMTSLDEFARVVL